MEEVGHGDSLSKAGSFSPATHQSTCAPLQQVPGQAGNHYYRAARPAAAAMLLLLPLHHREPLVRRRNGGGTVVAVVRRGGRARPSKLSKLLLTHQVPKRMTFLLKIKKKQFKQIVITNYFFHSFFCY